MPKTISVLVPVYNEGETLFAIAGELKKVFTSMPYNYEVIFINDGSKDNSLSVLKSIASTDANIYFISLSRNFGKDNALLAGLQYAKGDAIITIDADLQHPPALIPQMIAMWEEGNEVVYAYRENKNEHASNFNQFSSKSFYKLINQLSTVELEDGISDYRLIDRKVVDVLNKLKEDLPFFRGLVKWVGFDQKGIPYTPHARVGGETKYSTKALMRLALQGITSFSTKPLSIATYLGFTFSMLSLLYIPYVVFSLYYERPISGWSSIIVTIAFFGGLQLMILGIIGMYLGKLFMQTKERPHYIIKESNLK